jgi:hypothetical protein
MGAVCANAVDPLEIAAALEAEGLNDAAARAEYGAPDVFALAALLWDAVPRRPSSPDPGPNPWPVTPRLHLLRGLLFVLPGLPFAAAGGSAGGTIASAGAALVAGWAAGEALAYLGYAALGLAGAPASRWVLRRYGAALLAVAGLVAASVAALTGAGPAGALWGAGQACYLAAAAVVLVTGGERWLLGVLVPATAGSVLAVAGALPAWSAAVAAAVSVLLTVAVAGWRTRGGERPARGAVALAGGLPHAAYGLLAGALLCFGALAGGNGVSGGAALAGAVIALPVTLSMGPAEWILHRYRRRIHDLPAAATGLAAFGRAARRILAAAAGVYTGVLVVLTLAAAAAGAATGAFHLGWRAAATAVLLGAALFAALALRSCGLTGPVLAATGGTVAGQCAAAGLGAAVPAVQLAGSAVLALIVLPYALWALGKATPHR